MTERVGAAYGTAYGARGDHRAAEVLALAAPTGQAEGAAVLMESGERSNGWSSG
ncbi:hypothetical protein ACFCVY_06855 [Streptomyces sp. NPDC056411]|uniref:hypothetical protein n=1 Tax=Streptomyces sp. NPDC056411 TaxID=3345813 RepID=UPI0035D84AD9